MSNDVQTWQATENKGGGGDGQLRITDYMPKPKKRYPMDWPTYDLAQRDELRVFMLLLAGLCDNIPDEEYRFGRPRIPLQDMVYAAGFKVYSQKSLRRFQGLLQLARQQGYVDSGMSYGAISDFMCRPETTVILRDLIKLSGVPLSAADDVIAVDSSGFSTSRYARYFSYKHSQDRQYKTWLKLHVMCGVLTKIVTGVEISAERRHDAKFLPLLLLQTTENFQVAQVIGDKAYSSRKNIATIASIGATPRIPFRSNVSGKARGVYAWAEAHRFFMRERVRFMNEYYKRESAENVFSAMKAKFGGNLMSRNKVARLNELLLKVLCYNICVTILAMYRMKLDLGKFYEVYGEYSKVSLGLSLPN